MAFSPVGGLHTAVGGLDPTSGPGGIVAAESPTGRGRSTIPALVSGMEERMKGEALMAVAPVAAEAAKPVRAISRARPARRRKSAVAGSRVLPVTAQARILRASECPATLQAVIPSAMSWTLTGLRVGRGSALIGVIVGALIGATEGVGPLVAQPQAPFNASGAYAALVIPAVVALLAAGRLTFAECGVFRRKTQESVS